MGIVQVPCQLKDATTVISLAAGLVSVHLDLLVFVCLRPRTYIVFGVNKTLPQIYCAMKSLQCCTLMIRTRKRYGVL